ncbi:hypothetical protein F511_17524 [Dorcoceras hygrometricum]|uniref:Uncharacterized protein n=1 Tax=Dorcoceras hygrometricum TaxID=472368 RepID=A0A2Z7CST1_9LAMI|nr:hypothetical protein F511_17524 [Dorcoceras hygrometricum]
MKSRVLTQNVEVQYGSSADQVQSTSAVFKCRCIDKHSDQVQLLLVEFEISRYGDISMTHEDLLALVQIEVAAGRHRARACARALKRRRLNKWKRCVLSFAFERLAVGSFAYILVNQQARFEEFVELIEFYILFHEMNYLTRARHQRPAQVCFLTDSRKSLTEAAGSPNLNGENHRLEFVMLLEPATTSLFFRKSVYNSKLVSIERYKQYEPKTTNLTPNNDGNQRSEADLANSHPDLIKSEILKSHRFTPNSLTGPVQTVTLTNT